MKIELLPEQGNFYKANLHCHTNLSDGKFSPEEIKQLYREKGYSAVCFTDHEVLIGHEDLCDENFVALHGYEMAIKADPYAPTGNFMKVYHFNFIAEDPSNLIMPRCYVNSRSAYINGKHWRETLKPYDPNDIIEETHYDIDWINDYLEAVTRKGFLITCNHPQWSLQNTSDYLGLRHLHAIEVINGPCAVLNDNTSIHFEQMLRAGTNPVPVGGDDTHVLADCYLGWTMIKAPELSYQALIEAYKKGDCYASEGPEILHLVWEDGTVSVQTSAASQIILRGEGRRTLSKKSDSASLTEAQFACDPKQLGRYFRIEVRDRNGRVAISRAYQTADIGC